ncbi:MAG: isopentenyl-diphosphate Delta-isomerase [Gammaproteobacteria bacterium]|nr:isopentenyl-diphosphate Delta-isomerase [Gammaproteobacteria bacterium]
MNQIVSRETDLLVLVDSNDREIGLRDKRSCHEGRGILHRAVSVFLFDTRKRVLLQQRHIDKPLWGGCWSNSCCTHPFYGEEPIDAAKRRVGEELGLDVELEYVYKFEYQAEWSPEYSENELCSVFVGNVKVDPIVNESEIQAWRWYSTDSIDEVTASDSPDYTPWMKLEWSELRRRGYPDR